MRQKGREEVPEVNEKETKEKIVGDEEEEKGGVAREGREKDDDDFFCSCKWRRTERRSTVLVRCNRLSDAA